MRQISAALLALVPLAFILAGCLNSDEQYQRPRPQDSPDIYSNRMPVGRLADN